MPGSDGYEEAWKALQERFGHVDTVVSAAKKRIDQFPTIVKENSVQIRLIKKQFPSWLAFLRGITSFMSLAHKFLKQLLLNFLRAFAIDGPSLLKENQSYQPWIHLQIGWKKRQKLASQSSGGYQRKQNGSVQIHL